MTQETADRRAKVLYLITKATWGGAQRYVYDLATHLPRERFEPIVAYGVPGKLSSDLHAHGIETHELPSLGRDVAIISDIKGLIEIWRCIGQARPDVLHLNSSKAAALGALVGRLRSLRRIVFTVHGWPFKEDRAALSRALIWLVSWLTALMSHVVIAVSRDDMARGSRMPLIGKKMRLVHNGIELPMRLGSGAVIRSAFPAGATILGNIGELTRNKNQMALIERASADASLCVALVGEGEDRAALEEAILARGLSSRVKLFGFMPAADVLRGFDRFALTSRKEGLPYVLLEAKAAGLPIDANRVGGVSDILDGDLNDFSLSRMLERTIPLYR